VTTGRAVLAAERVVAYAVSRPRLLAVSGDGATIASVDDADRLRFWDRASVAPIRILSDDRGKLWDWLDGLQIDAIAFTGDRLAIAAPDAAFLLRVHVQYRGGHLELMHAAPQSAALREHGFVMFDIVDDLDVLDPAAAALFDTAAVPVSAELGARVPGSVDVPRLIALSADGRRLTIEQRPGLTRVLDTLDGTDVAGAAPLRGVSAVDEVTTAGATLRLREVASGRLRWEVGAGDGIFCDAVLAPDGRSVIACALQPGSARGGRAGYVLDRHDVRDGRRLDRILLGGGRGAAHRGGRVHVSADGALVCVQLNGWALTALELANGRVRAEVELLDADSYDYRPAVLSGDLRIVAWPRRDGTVAIASWDPA
jgi:hypothetical protein